MMATRRWYAEISIIVITSTTPMAPAAFAGKTKYRFGEGPACDNWYADLRE